jgi:hypothetical protein
VILRREDVDAGFSVEDMGSESERVPRSVDVENDEIEGPMVRRNDART